MAYNNKNIESQKRQLVEKDNETTVSVASDDEGKQKLIEDHSVQNASDNFRNHTV